VRRDGHTFRFPAMPNKVPSLLAGLGLPEGDDLLVRFVPGGSRGNNHLAVARQRGSIDRVVFPKPPAEPPKLLALDHVENSNLLGGRTIKKVGTRTLRRHRGDEPPAIRAEPDAGIALVNASEVEEFLAVRDVPHGAVDADHFVARRGKNNRPGMGVGVLM